jgi:hypothetical protein
MINAITASNVDIGGLSLHISPGKSPMFLCSLAKNAPTASARKIDPERNARA